VKNTQAKDSDNLNLPFELTEALERNADPKAARKQLLDIARLISLLQLAHRRIL